MSSDSGMVDLFQSGESRNNIFDTMQNGFKDVRHPKMEEAFRTLREKKQKSDKAKQNTEPEFTVLKVLSLLDEVEDFRASDFTNLTHVENDIKSIAKQIHDLHNKCKISRDARRNLTGMASNNQNYEQLNRVHRVNLENAAQLCEQFIDRCADITERGSINVKGRMCEITEVLEKVHCQGFIPINNLADHYSFIDSFVNGINEKLNRPIDESVSYKAVPFSSKCCIADQSCNNVKMEYECSDANERLIRNVTKEYLSKQMIIPDMRTPYTTRYCVMLQQQYKLAMDTIRDLEFMIDKINTNAKTNVFTRDHDHSWICVKERTEGIPLSFVNKFQDQHVSDTEIEGLVHHLDFYNTLKTDILNRIERVDSNSIDFVLNKLIKFIPDALYNRQRAIRKGLYVYMAFIVTVNGSYRMVC